MPITQSLNSKANVKKQTNQDLPFAPQQPVISSYYAVSTASQTVINLSFSVDTVNLTDQFFLFIDGKKLRLGASNDFTFTSIGSNGYSSQVTMNYALPVNLNIQAFQLGLKKESEFNMDNRFTQLYEAEGNGFQGFVNTTSFINNATTTTGTPAAGTFYSTVIGRAPMVDLSQDLKPRMAIDRVQMFTLTQVNGEIGPNGEPVYTTPNDYFGQFRALGSWNISGQSPVYGNRIYTTTVGDSIEYTFYGTGLNILFGITNTSVNISVTVNGVAATAFTTSASQSGILGGRGYNLNAPINVVNGLTLGLYTVKMTAVSGTIDFYGFEVLNESSLVKINPGVGYIQSKKYTTSALQSYTYNADAVGTRGGRVVVYQNGDGTIGRAWQAVNGSQANYASADHTNEEVARTYFWREFGAGRFSSNDDFSTVNLNTVTSARSFTLEDGTTTLSAGSPYNSRTDVNNPIDSVQSFNGSVMTFVFVGTGLDIIRSAGTGGTGTISQSILVDGVSIGTIPGSLNAQQILTQKVVSGLPYGTHTVQISRASGTTGEGISSFIVYQPKKPSIPSGAIELADYNVMANYDSSTITGTTVADNLKVPAGTLYKHPLREYNYVGANWAIFSIDTSAIGGWTTTTNTTNSQPVTYTFFGTGLVLHMGGSVGGTYDFSVAIDGVLNSSGVARSNGSNLGSGSYRSTSSTGYAPTRIEFTGLSMAMHTITVQRTAGTGNITVQGLHIITPIHSYKTNFPADFNNTLNPGSQGISDNRKFTPVKDSLPANKAFAQAVGVNANPTTTSTAYVPMPDMNVSIKTSGGPLKISFLASGYANAANISIYTRIHLDGVPVGVEALSIAPTVGNAPVVQNAIVPASAGVHRVEIYWAAAGSTITIEQNRRILTVEEK